MGRIAMSSEIDLEELKRLARAAQVNRDLIEGLHWQMATNPLAVLALIERVERAETAIKGLHTDVSAALAEAERQSTGTHGMSVPYTGPFASGLRLPSVVRDLREQQRVISAALEGAK